MNLGWRIHTPSKSTASKLCELSLRFLLQKRKRLTDCGDEHDGESAEHGYRVADPATKKTRSSVETVCATWRTKFGDHDPMENGEHDLPVWNGDVDGPPPLGTMNHGLPAVSKPTGRPQEHSEVRFYVGASCPRVIAVYVPPTQDPSCSANVYNVMCCSSRSTQWGRWPCVMPRAADALCVSGPTNIVAGIAGLNGPLPSADLKQKWGG